MKTLGTLLLLAVLFWSSSLFAEYCKTGESGNERSCVYKVSGRPNNTQIIISYTQQGWSMMIATFPKEFIVIEGDAKIAIDKGEKQNLEYVTTHRDYTIEGKLMEAAIYKVDEKLLHEMGNAGGKIRFWLTSQYAKDLELNFWSKRFRHLDKFMAETKTFLGFPATD